ncbi:uncharacterized protein [Leptinotarsa decemlineata]|uniref:uncharacterized protein n=1 Tax=Leptinotarsa decemlineata TaxID=7539 RepID=UPI003D309784
MTYLIFHWEKAIVIGRTTLYGSFMYYHHHESQLLVRLMFNIKMTGIRIISKLSGLALDGNEKFIRAAMPDNTIGQIWSLESLGNGTFVIHSFLKRNMVLDIENGCHGENIILYPRHGNENQQFYINSDGTIVPAGDRQKVLQMVTGKVIVRPVNNLRNVDHLFNIE